MTQLAIFEPVLALVLLTFLVLLRIPYVRFMAVRSRQLTVSDFRLGESPRVPEAVALPNRNYMNLLELPMLFYTLAVALYVTQRVDAVVLALAWVYVGLRVVHSGVHLTFNHVLTRLTMFALSNFTLAAMWTYFALKIL